MHRQTQLSLSDAPPVVDRRRDFLVTVREVRPIARGGFLVPLDRGPVS